MVFGKWFGGGKKGDAPKPRSAADETRAAFLRSLDPVWREAFLLINRDPDVDKVFKDEIYVNLQKGELEAVRKTIRFVLKDMSPEQQERVKHAGQHLAWADFETLSDAGILIPNSKTVPMGRYWSRQSS